MTTDKVSMERADQHHSSFEYPYYYRNPQTQIRWSDQEKQNENSEGDFQEDQAS
ncbi:MAG: hypothetical protein NTU98_06325 [Bacteroidetes bacterium]|nr:hypothetical protein [Bacteroidota bacterium]